MSKRVALLVAILLLPACAQTLEARGDPIAGAEVAEEVELSCGLCHVLEAAGFTGQSGPNLDVLQPGYQRVLDAMRDGPGLMPSFRNRLTTKEMHDLAAFISGEAGG